MVGGRRWDRTAMPPRIAALPTDAQGRPIPWFVAPGRPGRPLDFRVASPERMRRAMRHRLCWTCGHRIHEDGATFVLGPMCGVNRESAEPPSHLPCAAYSAARCPFLSNPEFQRRERNLPAHVPPAGVPIMRNPGVTLLWTTAEWDVVRVPGGVLFSLGQPIAVAWLTRGRPATRIEVRAAIRAGMPELRRACDLDDDTMASHRDLHVALGRLLRLLPAAPAHLPGDGAVSPG